MNSFPFSGATEKTEVKAIFKFPQLSCLLTLSFKRPERCVHKVLQYHKRESQSQQAKERQKLRVKLDLNNTETSPSPSHSSRWVLRRLAMICTVIVPFQAYCGRSRGSRWAKNSTAPPKTCWPAKGAKSSSCIRCYERKEPSWNA